MRVAGQCGSVGGDCRGGKVLRPRARRETRDSRESGAVRGGGRRRVRPRQNLQPVRLYGRKRTETPDARIPKLRANRTDGKRQRGSPARPGRKRKTAPRADKNHRTRTTSGLIRSGPATLLGHRLHVSRHLTGLTRRSRPTSPDATRQLEPDRRPTSRDCSQLRGPLLYHTAPPLCFVRCQPSPSLHGYGCKCMFFSARRIAARRRAWRSV